MGSTLIVSLFVIGNIVGSGFFIMPSLMASLGSNLVYSWVIGCSMALIFALIFGRLYLMFPKVSVLSDYFEHSTIKKMVSWVYWISCVISNTGILIVLVGTLNIKNANLLAVILMGILTISNSIVRYHTVEKIETLLTVLKFSILVILPIGFFMWKPDIFVVPPQMGSSSEIATLGISSFWAFIGIETAALFGSGKSARRGLLLGVIACSILYISSSLFLAGSVPLDELQKSSSPFSLLAREYVGVGSEKYMSFLIAFTSFGALYGWVAATGKMSLLFAESKLFGSVFLAKTPSANSNFGLWSSSAITSLIFFAVSNLNINDQFAFVSNICIYVTLFIYAMCSYVVVRKSGTVIPKILGVLGMLIVIGSFLLSWKMLIITFMVLIFVYSLVFLVNLNDKKKLTK